jgi:hypothetical protein
MMMVVGRSVGRLEPGVLAAAGAARRGGALASKTGPALALLSLHKSTNALLLTNNKHSPPPPTLVPKQPDRFSVVLALSSSSRIEDDARTHTHTHTNARALLRSPALALLLISTRPRTPRSTTNSSKEEALSSLPLFLLRSVDTTSENMAGEKLSNIGLVGLAVMGQVR